MTSFGNRRRFPDQAMSNLRAPHGGDAERRGARMGLSSTSTWGLWQGLWHHLHCWRLSGASTITLPYATDIRRVWGLGAALPLFWHWALGQHPPLASPPPIPPFAGRTCTHSAPSHPDSIDVTCRNTRSISLSLSPSPVPPTGGLLEAPLLGGEGVRIPQEASHTV